MMVERKNYSMPKSVPPISTRQVRAAQAMGKTLLQRAKVMVQQRNVCITCRKGSPLIRLDTQRLINSVLPGLELKADELSQIFDALESPDISFDSRLKVPVGDLAAFHRFYGDRLTEQIPSILAFYSIIRTARKEGLNIHVWVEGLPEAVDIQEVPSKKAFTVRVFQAMSLVSMRLMNDDLVEAEQFLQAWLADGHGEGINYFFRDIIEQAAEPTSQD